MHIRQYPVVLVWWVGIPQCCRVSFQRENGALRQAHIYSGRLKRLLMSVLTDRICRPLFRPEGSVKTHVGALIVHIAVSTIRRILRSGEQAGEPDHTPNEYSFPILSLSSS
jgi:hypothetical protein